LMQLATKIMPKVTPLEGALNSLFAATSPEAPVRAQGKFILPVGQLAKYGDKWTEDSKGNHELWEHSERAIRSVA
jgi:hypothetical protein